MNNQLADFNFRPKSSSHLKNYSRTTFPLNIIFPSKKRYFQGPFLFLYLLQSLVIISVCLLTYSSFPTLPQLYSSVSLLSTYSTVVISHYLRLSANLHQLSHPSLVIFISFFLLAFSARFTFCCQDSRLGRCRPRQSWARDNTAATTFTMFSGHKTVRFCIMPRHSLQLFNSDVEI